MMLILIRRTIGCELSSVMVSGLCGMNSKKRERQSQPFLLRPADSVFRERSVLWNRAREALWQ